VSFEVDPPALEAFAGTSDRRSEEFGRIASSFGSVQVPAGAFGRIPVISSRVHNAYLEHTQRCQDGAKSAEEAMHAIAEGMRAMATNYRETDGHAADDLKLFHQEFDGIAVRFGR
jgi:hypothetical protein